MFFGSPKAELLGIDDIIASSDGTDIANNKEVKAESAADGGDKNAKLEALRLSFASCSKCGLAKTRTNIVFGEGNPYTDLMFVGEGPGADEDRTGRPFVGKSGQLLTKMIEAMGISRNNVYIAN
ncbi:MAG: uracil-DNA glycosylase, partial [Mucispirillum sp.]|nr:uracil-DNA glycosylase [Mucispirillum sp.]